MKLPLKDIKCQKQDCREKATRKVPHLDLSGNTWFCEEHYNRYLKMLAIARFKRDREFERQLERQKFDKEVLHKQ